MSIEFSLYLLLGGLIGGFSAGLIGIGGGTIYIFIIPLALDAINFPPDLIAPFTIANSFFAMFFASLSIVFI